MPNEPVYPPPHFMAAALAQPRNPGNRDESLSALDHTAYMHHADHVLDDLMEHAITIKP